MKTMISKLTIAAATLAITAGVASAQAMKAEIPFAFRSGGAVLSAGTYRVDMKGENRIVTLYSYDTKRSVMMISKSATSVSKEWKAKGEPVLIFECGVGRCDLTTMWNGSENQAYTLPHRAFPKNEATTVALVRLVRGSGE